MVITFIGHRSLYDAVGMLEKIKNVLDEIIKKDEKTVFLLGGYGEFDAECAKACRQIAKENASCELVLVTPYMTESHLKKVKEMMTSKIYDTVLYPPLEQVPLRFAISKRNEWMIEQSDVIITFVRHSYGGAYKSLLYAQRKKKKMIHLAREE